MAGSIVTDAYLYLEERIKERSFTSLALALIVCQVSAAVLLLAFADFEQSVVRVFMLLMGSVAIALGARLRARAPIRGRILAQLGSVPGIELLIWLVPPVGIMIAVLYAIVVAISFVV
jgi:hypothetical protein